MYLRPEPSSSEKAAAGWAGIARKSSLRESDLILWIDQYRINERFRDVCSHDEGCQAEKAQVPAPRRSDHFQDGYGNGRRSNRALSFQSAFRPSKPQLSRRCRSNRHNPRHARSLGTRLSSCAGVSYSSPHCAISPLRLGWSATNYSCARVTSAKSVRLATRGCFLPNDHSKNSLESYAER